MAPRHPAESKSTSGPLRRLARHGDTPRAAKPAHGPGRLTLSGLARIRRRSAGALSRSRGRSRRRQRERTVLRECAKPVVVRIQHAPRSPTQTCDEDLHGNARSPQLLFVLCELTRRVGVGASVSAFARVFDTLWAVNRRAWTQNCENNPMHSRKPPARSSRAALGPGAKSKMLRHSGGVPT